MPLLKENKILHFGILISMNIYTMTWISKPAGVFFQSTYSNESVPGLLLDFITENLAPDFYNQGVDDSYRSVKETAEDQLSLRI
jgi:hypothetical protein